VARPAIAEALFRAQRSSGIDFGGSPRRQVRHLERCPEQDEGRGREHERLDAGHPVEQDLQELTGAGREQQANGDPQAGEPAAFAKHLLDQPARLRTEGDPDAELACASRGHIGYDAITATFRLGAGWSHCGDLWG
jgi:hypothetical protein